MIYIFKLILDIHFIQLYIIYIINKKKLAFEYYILEDILFNCHVYKKKNKNNRNMNTNFEKQK